MNLEDRVLICKSREGSKCFLMGWTCFPCGLSIGCWIHKLSWQGFRSASPIEMRGGLYLSRRSPEPVEGAKADARPQEGMGPLPNEIILTVRSQKAVYLALNFTNLQAAR